MLSGAGYLKVLNPPQTVLVVTEALPAAAEKRAAVPDPPPLKPPPAVPPAAITLPVLDLPPSETAIAAAAPAKRAGDDAGGGEAGKGRQGAPVAGRAVGTLFQEKTLKLTMGRLDTPGGSRLQEMFVTIKGDGTTKVQMNHYFYRMYHEGGPATRSVSGEGRWWVEGQAWCHSAPDVNYGAEECYDMTEENGLLRLYYTGCTARSSMYCKTGRLGAEGMVVTAPSK